jgi:hypothetical protein
LTVREEKPVTSINISRTLTITPNEIGELSKPHGGKRTSQSSAVDSYMKNATLFKQSNQHSIDEPQQDINALYQQYELQGLISSKKNKNRLEVSF